VRPEDRFPPTLAAARVRIDAVRPADYARSRNAIDGAVTYLSPYITHGFVSLPEVLAGVAARHRLDVQHKFVFELGWRAYFRHVWQHRGDAILQSLHEGLLPEQAYVAELPADIREARTGVPAIDTAVRTLYATGTLHNHARMWLASYVVHLRKVHWRTGADWLVAHLLDGDLASNHLSWQWVAGTGSHKPYLFNADNVARYAPAQWHSTGSVIDQSYETLDAMARSPRPVRSTPQGDGVEEPALRSAPQGAAAVTATSAATSLATSAPQAADVAGRGVWLVHPWALGEPPADLPHNCLRVGLWPTEHHDAWPWSPARWAFVGTRMAALTPLRWCASRPALAQALAGARSVHTLADPHVSALLPSPVVQHEPLRLFADVDRPCDSFSTWWSRSTRGAKTLPDLPGLAALAALGTAGPLFEPAGGLFTDPTRNESLS
jgi:deoxyribodipyrimidine photo-lyase